MANIGFKIPPNSVFFNTKEVQTAKDKAEKKILARFGFLTRRDARSSMRKKKKPSKKGEPPRVKTGLLKNFLFFSYDKIRHSVVIGPARLAGFKGAGEAPSKLEDELDRPYMRPAYERQLAEHMPDMWKNSIR